MPPGMLALGVAAVGALALSLGFVVALAGEGVGVVILVGGLALVAWSVAHRRGPRR